MIRMMIMMMIMMMIINDNCNNDNDDGCCEAVVGIGDGVDVADVRPCAMAASTARVSYSRRPGQLEASWRPGGLSGRACARHHGPDSHDCACPGHGQTWGHILYKNIKKPANIATLKE